MTLNPQERIVIVKHCPNCRSDDPIEVHFVCGHDEEDVRMKIHLEIWEDRFDRNKEMVVMTVDEAVELRDKLDSVLAGPESKA